MVVSTVDRWRFKASDAVEEVLRYKALCSSRFWLELSRTVFDRRANQVAALRGVTLPHCVSHKPDKPSEPSCTESKLKLRSVNLCAFYFSLFFPHLCGHRGVRACSESGYPPSRWLFFFHFRLLYTLVGWLVGFRMLWLSGMPSLAN